MDFDYVDNMGLICKVVCLKICRIGNMNFINLNILFFLCRYKYYMCFFLD